ncbi:hypothetical protein [Spirosoma validum]|nr:hypothetical protein [Spirosoma validum]
MKRKTVIDKIRHEVNVLTGGRNQRRDVSSDRKRLAIEREII